MALHMQFIIRQLLSRYLKKSNRLKHLLNGMNQLKKRVVIHVPPHVTIYLLHPHKILTHRNLDPTQIEENVWL